MDAKTDKGKETTPSYRKDDLGQLSDHVQWVRDNAEIDKIIPAFVGPEVAASESANPPPKVKVAALKMFHDIGETLKTVYRDVAANALPLTVGPTVTEQFGQRGLLWPQIEAAFGLVELRELKSK